LSSRSRLAYGLPPPDRLLWLFALPVIVIVTAQAFLSRRMPIGRRSYVLGNRPRDGAPRSRSSWRWLKGSLARIWQILRHTAWRRQRPLVPPARGNDPFARTLGWRALAKETAAVLAEARQAGRPFGAVLTDDRAITAELLYYMRDEPTPVYAWHDRGTRPRDHYELSRAYRKGSPEPVLLVGLRRSAGKAGESFAVAETVPTSEVPAGSGRGRRVMFFRLEGFKGE